MTDIIHGSRNVYADLEFPDANEMFVKAKLVTKIRQILKERGWTQKQAGQVLGMPQPKLSKMLSGEFRGISEAKMLECLARLGRDVQIVVGPETNRTEAGHVDVVFSA